jgi:hypothetical protein
VPLNPFMLQRPIKPVCDVISRFFELAISAPLLA